MTTSLVLRALQHVWNTLEPLGIPLALMGGLAVSVWKHIRATRDVDLLIHLKLNDAPHIIGILDRAGIKPLRQPPVLSLQDVHILQTRYEVPGSYTDIRVDFLFAESALHESALARRVRQQLPEIDQPIDVVSCEDLILFKLLAGRVLDRLDAAGVLRANRATIDLAYLKKWVGQLGLERSWVEIYDEAFPGESPPA